MYATCADYANILVEGKIRGISFVVEPVIANNTNGFWVFLDKFDDIGCLFHSHYIFILDRFTAKNGIFDIVDGARLWIVKDNSYSTFMLSTMKFFPSSDFTIHYGFYIFSRKKGVYIILVDDERECIVSKLNGNWLILACLKIFYFSRLPVTCCEG